MHRTFLFLLTLLLLFLAAPLRADTKDPKTDTRVIRSTRNGPWSAPATWEGNHVPGNGDKVLVRTGHAVIYDVKSDAVIRSLHLSGTLSFAPDRDTLLNVGLIKIQPGDSTAEEGFDCEAHMMARDPKKPRPALLAGTPELPIQAGHRAVIRLHYVNGMDRESCPAIVCCGGRMDFHGAPLSHTWVKLGKTVAKGDTSLTLSEAVTGWNKGDRVIVTASKRDYRAKGLLTEERIIKAIDGTQITLDKALANEHLGTGDYRAEAANLSRNVVVESADPEGVRGHTMYHKGSAGSISYAEFRHLGKRDVLGRYSLHFHLAGDTMRGSYVIGASIWDSHNRWLTIHGTNYLVVRDNVGYRSIGHGFFLEDGTEVYNVLDHNLAVGAEHGKRLPKQALPFDQNAGAGFWWANSLNTFTRNVAAENDRYGFRYEATPSSRLPLVFKVRQADGSRKPVDIRTLPFVRFDGNEVHSSTGLYGVNLGEGVNRVGPDTRHPFIVRDLKIWDVHYGFRPQVPSLLVENLNIHQAAYGIYHPNYDNHVYRNVLISQTNTEPFNRGHDDISSQYGALTVDGLTFAGIRSGSFMPLIQISDNNPTGKGVSHFRNVKTVNWSGSKDRALVNRGGGPRPKPKTQTGVPVYLHDWFGPGRDGKVVSTAAPDLKGDPLQYHSEPLLTGNESRVAEVRNVEFPKLLDPVDDLPPTTVITSISRSGGKLVVRGTTADNGTVKRVVVNGIEARALRDNFAEWEATLTGSASQGSVSAHSEDAAGNVEKTGHVVSVAVR
jgi:G8 domain